MKKLLVLPLLLLLTACATEVIQEVPTAYAKPGIWQLAYGTANWPVTQNPVSFTFPNTKQGSANYLIDGPTRKHRPGQTIYAVFTVKGDGKLVPTQGADVEPNARVRLFIQRKGDNLSAQGDMQSYRWWSTAYVDLIAPGTYKLTVKLDPSLWTDVYGRNGSSVPALFNAAVNDLANIGMTFGGEFAGHGDYTKSGVVTFTLNSFLVG